MNKTLVSRILGGIVIATLLASAVASGQSGIITTVAGRDNGGFSGDGGPATSAELGGPSGIVVDGQGNLFIADTGNNRIRKVAANGVIATVAGNGNAGFSGDGGPATAASLNIGVTGVGIAVDSSGNLYIADTNNNRVRKVSSSGIITTVAGNGFGAQDGLGGFTGDGGPAISAQLFGPSGVAVDALGNLFVVDLGNNRIRKVSTGGIITTIAGSGCTITVATPNCGGFSGDGEQATSATLNHPGAIALDGSGNLYIADNENNRVRKVAPNGIITTVAGNGPVCSFSSLTCTGSFSGDGGPATSASLNFPGAITVDGSGNLFIADPGNLRIRKVSAAGIITTVAGNGLFDHNIFDPAGDGGPATAAELNDPEGVAIDASGNLFIADALRGRIREVSASGSAGGSTSQTITFGALGNVTLGVAPFTISATASSGLAVTFTSTTTSVCTVSGGVVTILAVGTCSITASQAGNANYAAAIPITQSFTVSSTTTGGGQSGIITTVAGVGPSCGASNTCGGFSGDGGPATSASLNYPTGLALDSSGNLFIADWANNRIRKVSASGVITTVAGNGIAGFSGDGGPATSGSLNLPNGVVVDSSGDLFISDYFNNRIRKVSATGIITTIAGNGSAGFSGDGGPATAASLFYPSAIAVDAFGNLFIALNGNHRIRKVSASGIITTVAGNGTQGFSGDGGPATSASLNFPAGIAVDASGDLFIADTLNSRIRKVLANGIITTFAGNGTEGFSGDGGPAISASLFEPTGIAVDAFGNVFFSDNYAVASNSRIREILANGTITTVAGGGTGGLGDGGPATSATVNGPGGVALDASGNLFIADSANNRIRKVSSGSTGNPASQTITFGALSNVTLGLAPFTVSATASSGLAVTFTSTTPAVCTVSGNTVTIVALGTCSIAASQAGNTNYAAATPVTQSFTISSTTSGGQSGIITTVAGNGYGAGSFGGYSGDGSAATSAELSVPTGVAVDSGGNLYVADSFNNVIRKVTAGTGVITTVAGNRTAGYSGDGAPGTSAELNFPNGVAVDGSGNLYIADSFNNVIRKVTVSTGVITTVAGNGFGSGTRNGGYSGDGGAATSAKLNFPNGVALDGTGNLYIVDSFNNRIRKVTVSTGVITTVAGNGYGAGTFSTQISGGYTGDGGAAISAELFWPQGVAVDGSGNLYIADQSNQRIRKVTASTGIITTVAGTGRYGYSGDGGLATSAQLAQPYGLSVDSSGNLYIVDEVNQRIRKVTASTGVITTVAGNGYGAGTYLGGYSGDGGAATSAKLNDPQAVAVDSGGNLYIADTQNMVIRKVTASAAAACSYMLGSGGQSFPASGGVGTITITTGTGCPWTVGTLPAGVVVNGATSGTGSGTVTFQVSPNSGADASSSITIAGQTFTIEEESGTISGLVNVGSLAEVVSQGGWNFELDAVNLGTSAAIARVNFADSNGNALQIPLTFPQTSTTALPETGATLDRTVNPNARIVIDSSGPGATQLLASGQLLSNGSVSGFGIFSYPAFNWNAVVPLEARKATTYSLPFDNTGVLTTGVALANITTSPVSVNVTILNDAGVRIGTDAFNVPAQGYQTPFMLPTKYPQTLNVRGTIQFTTASPGQINVLGVRANGTAALTTLPVLSNVDLPGGSISDLTYSGGFTSTFYLVNTGSSPASFTLSFYNQSGNPVSVPLSLPQTTSTQTTTALTQTLAAGQMLEVATQAAPVTSANVAGSAQLTTTGSISGFEIFDYSPNGQEASVPLETRTAKNFVLVYDNTNGLATGVALANSSAAAASIAATIYDDQGNVLQNTTIPLTGHAQQTIVLNSSFTVTANKRGMVTFVVPSSGPISMIGIRVGTIGATTTTTIPILAK